MERYLTTPIYYASGDPHLGHAYTTLVADCYRRFYELTGDEVLLVTGTDEHGQKIERAASRAGQGVQDFVDERSRAFQRLWQALDVGVDRFERTTSARHNAVATEFWQRLVRAGDVYAGKYEGKYCVDCEQYFTEGETCPVHHRPLETFSEASWFFQLGKYQQWLIDLLESNPQFIVPAARRNEVLSFLRGNRLRDLSISRSSTTWGIPVPDDAAHVMYVWVDALTTYLTGAAGDSFNGLDDEGTRRRFSQAVHFIGKDILTFHAVYWPALLHSAGLPLPRQIVVNGWLTVEGRKIAKSDPETIVDAARLTSETGRDALRLYLLRAASLGHDVDYSRKLLIQIANADLANNIGNLVSRFTALAARHFPEGWHDDGARSTAASDLLERVAGHARRVRAHFEAFEPSHAAREAIAAGAAVNAFVQQEEPWREADRHELGTVLSAVYAALSDLSILLAPVVPDSSARIRQALGLGAHPRWDELGRHPETIRVVASGPIHARIRS